MRVTAAVAAWSRIAAVVRCELRSLARGRSLFAQRTAYGTLVVAILGVPSIGFLQMRQGASFSASLLVASAQSGFMTIVWIQALVAVVLGVFLGVSSVATERQNQTLGLLVLSQLKAHEVVVGKLVALVGLLASVLLASLPILALIGWAGGVEYLWLLRLGLLTLALSCMGLAAGLALGLRFRSPLAAALSAATVISLPVLRAVWLASNRPGSVSTDVFAAPPVGVLMVATQSEQAGKFWVSLVACLVATLLLLLLAVRWLPGAAVGGPGRGLRGSFEGLDTFFERINLGGVRLESRRSVEETGAHPRVGRPLGARPVSGNPVTWVTRVAGGLGILRYDFRVASVLVALTLLVLGLSFRGAVWAAFYFAAASGAVLLVPAWAGGTALGKERTSKSLIVLLSTPLTASTILHGKTRAYLKVFVLMFSVPTVAMLLFALWFPFAGATGWVTRTVAVLIAEAMCAYTLALNLSLHVEGSLRASLGALVVLAGAHLALLVSLFIVFQLSTGGAPSTFILASFAALILWIACTFRAAWVAWQKRYPRVAFAAGIAFLVPTLGGISGVATDHSGPVLFRILQGAGMNEASTITLFGVLLLVVFSVTLYVYAGRTFDWTLGRS